MKIYACAAVALSLAIAGCSEELFSRDADRQVYKIQRERQYQTLGAASETAISIGESPSVPERAYSKVPTTDNRLPENAPATTTTAPAAITVGAATREMAGLPATTSANGLTTTELDDKEELPPMPQFPVAAENDKKSHAFTLDDCFNYSLAHSREYVSRKEDLYITTLRVTLERHAFEPRPFATTEIGLVGNGEYNDYAAALQAAQTIGVRQKLPYGGEVTATALAQGVNKIREGIGLSQSAGVILEARIPLLRGAGMAAQEDLIQAERELVYEVREFERFRRGFLVTIASSYFDLLNQKAQILNRVRNTESYIFIYQRTLALFKAGRQKISLLDVQRAKQSALEAQSSLISAINEFELKVDGYKLLLGMPTDEKLTIEAQLLSVAPPTTTETDAIKIATRLRLDLQTSHDRVDDATRGVAVAGNALLPDLNIAARTSLGTDPDVRTFRVEPQRFDYGATATLDWGLDRTAERNAYRQSQIGLDRAKRSVDSLNDQMVIEVRNAVRGLKQQQDLVALQKNNIALAQRRKAFAEIQFRDGKIDNRDYIDAESALLDAQNGLAAAISQLQIATLAYLRDTDQFRVDVSGKFIQPGEAQKLEVKKEAATKPAETKP